MQINTDLTEHELRMIYNFLNRFFMGLLRQVSPKDLYKYVLHQKVFNPTIFFTSMPKKIKIKLRRLIEKNENIVDTYITAENFIEQSKNRRKDLYEILNTEKGRRWTERFVKVVKQILYKKL